MATIWATPSDVDGSDGRISVGVGGIAFTQLAARGVIGALNGGAVERCEQCVTVYVSGRCLEFRGRTVHHAQIRLKVRTTLDIFI